MGDTDGKIPGIHAECDAITKLAPLKRKKKPKCINILVIRLSTKNKIQSSKPCSNCIEKMKTLPPKKGYVIQNVYYSNAEGEIEKSSLDDLEKEERHYSRFYRKQKIDS